MTDTLMMAFFDASIRWLPLFLLALGLTRLARLSAAERHAAWGASLLALLTLPLLAALLPSVALPLPQTAQLHALGGSLSLSATSAADPLAAAAAATESSLGTVALLSGLWLVGAAVMLLRVAVGRALGQHLIAHSQPMAGSDLEPLLRRAGLRYKVELRLAAVQIPMTTGILRRYVLLPLAADSWPRAQLESCLLHELEHIRRGDVAILELAMLTRALHWFNPLAWVAVAALRREAEQATDDEVILGGVEAEIYAGHLVAAARHAAGVGPLMAMAMARSSLEARVRSVLARHPLRRPATRSTLTPMFLPTLALLLPLSVLQLSPASAAPPKAAPHAKAAASPKEIFLQPGEKTLLDFGAISRLSSSNEKVAALAIKGKKDHPMLELRAAAPGDTVLRVWVSGQPIKKRRVKVRNFLGSRKLGPHPVQSSLTLSAKGPAWKGLLYQVASVKTRDPAQLEVSYEPKQKTLVLKGLKVGRSLVDFKSEDGSHFTVQVQVVD